MPKAHFQQWTLRGLQVIFIYTDLWKARLLALLLLLVLLLLLHLRPLRYYY